MPFPFLIPAIVGLATAGIGAAVGAYNTNQQKKVADQNLEFQKENLQWQKDSQYKTWDREDNAVVRRVQDLQNAGLSPTLAAGSAAQTHTPIQTHAPQREQVDYTQAAAMAMNALKMRADIAHTQAETDRVRETTRLMDPSYQLEVRRTQAELRRVANDTTRVQQAAEQLGINERYLQNDIQRVANDYQRVQNDTQRVLNDSARVDIERNAKEVVRLLSEAQIRNYDQAVLTSKAQALKISVEAQTALVEHRSLVYDYALSRVFGIRTRDAMDGGIYSHLKRDILNYRNTHSNTAHTLGDVEMEYLRRKLGM